MGSYVRAAVHQLGTLKVEKSNQLSQFVAPGCVRIAVVCAGVNNADKLLCAYILRPISTSVYITPASHFCLNIYIYRSTNRVYGPLNPPPGFVRSY